jgi:hypothetical protein
MTPELVEELTGMRWEDTAHACHAVSLALVKSGHWPRARVARGSCRGVGSQHSWVVVGDNCYAPNAKIVDATLWSYDDMIKGVWTGTAHAGLHHPHGGWGSIWTHSQPPPPTDEVIPLDVELSNVGRTFRELAAPDGLDIRGWHVLAHSPVRGWPAAEIIGAMYDTPRLKMIPPIDIVGMLTDKNPNGLYW